MVGQSIIRGMVTGMSTSSRDRIIIILKTKGSQTVARLARELGVTTMAVRQHLAILSGEGLVDSIAERGRIGRPAKRWRLTGKSDERFPDSHAGLVVVLLQAAQHTFGSEGLDRLTTELVARQTDSYRKQMPRAGSAIEARVAALVKIRCAEGYMAEWRRGRDGSIELIENHCAISRAAHACPQLCHGELTLFRKVLGQDVSVERTEHLLRGDRRCAYRICLRSHPMLPPGKATPPSSEARPRSVARE